MSDQIKNLPHRIWLQVTGDEEPAPGDDFDDLVRSGEVTWCVDKINDHDVEFILADEWVGCRSRIEQLQAENAALKRQVPQEIKDLVDDLRNVASRQRLCHLRENVHEVCDSLAAAIEKAEE